MADSGLRFVDAHIHVQPWEELRPAARETLEHGQGELATVREVMSGPGGPAALIKLLDREGVAFAGVVNYVAPEVMGFTSAVNAFAARYRKHAPDRIVAYGGIHPPLLGGKAGVRAEMDSIVGTGIDAVKIHPPHQLFAANAYRDGGTLPALAEVYEAAQTAGMPVLFHTGTSVFPGARNKYGDPLAIDDVAVDFPRLRIIMAHGGRPLWMETAFFLLRRHKNVLLDISSIPPGRLLEYFPRIAEVADRVLFGSDWPAMGVPGMRRNAEAVDALPLPATARADILGGTARRVFRRS